MRQPTKLKQRLLRDDSGFTLIEMLIVILILGILSGITVLSVQAFQDRAAEACDDANSAMQRVVDAANEAGVANPVDVEGDCSGGVASPPGDPFTASFEAIAGGGTAGGDTPGTISVSTDVGELLVAVAGTRSTPGSDPTAPGYDLVDVADGDGRHIAVFVRIADDTAADGFQPTWTGTGNVTTRLYSFSRDDGAWSLDTSNFHFVPTAGSNTNAGSFVLDSAEGFNPSGLMVAGAVRGVTGGLSGPDLSGLATATQGSNTQVVTGYANVGTGSHGSTLTWTGADTIWTGFVLVIR